MTARSIQRRLFLLLIQAFAAVVLLTVFLLFTLTVVYLASSGNSHHIFQTPMFATLETYYLAHGSWDGVEITFKKGAISAFPDIPPRWENALLVDQSGQVIAAQGSTTSSLVRTTYYPEEGDERFMLYVREQPVGALVVRNEKKVPWQLVLRLLAPVGFLSLLPAILTLTIGILLTRRVVNPLADVIASAQSVAAGNLATRVEVRGPQDLHALTDSFNHMADTLQRNDQERRAMLADVAHELRTPLSVIRGRLEGMLDGVYQPDEAHIAQVLEETYLLERLVDDLRLLTLAEARQLPFDLRSTDLNQLAERAVNLFEAEALEKGITLGLETTAIPLIQVDPQRIEQVIGNLIGNALRYTPEGGRVVVRIARVSECVELSVSDNGPGVADSDLPHLFDRFWRGEKSRSRSAGGAGLGLAIARQLIEAQGGAVFVYNRPEGGLAVGFRCAVEQHV